MPHPDTLRLPRVNEPPRNLALLVIGGALAKAYQDILAQPLPAPLHRIVRSMERRETLPNARL